MPFFTRFSVIDLQEVRTKTVSLWSYINTRVSLFFGVVGFAICT